MAGGTGLSGRGIVGGGSWREGLGIGGSYIRSCLGTYLLIFIGHQKASMGFGVTVARYP